MDNYILGLNIGNHDSAAAIIKNGEVIKYIEQERISRNKMALGEPPIEAALACLNSEGISIDNISAISIGMDWGYRNKIYEMTKEEQEKYKNFENVDWFLPSEIFGEKLPHIYIIKHHLAHAASAYRVSGFKECAILVVDNRGEDVSTSLGFAKNGEITFFKKVNIQNSLGMFYNRAAEYTGLYGKHREVGKFMGLASYGNPTMKMPLAPSRNKLLFDSLPNIEDESIFNSISLRAQHFKEYFEANCFPYEAGNVEEIMSYANFAASVQKSLEDVLIDFVKELKEITNMDNLVLAGGVALNCSANGKIEKSGIFKNIFIPPFPSDAGTSIGSALEVYHQLYGKESIENKLNIAGLGISYSQQDIQLALEKYNEKIRYVILDDSEIYHSVAKEISEGKIIGWMQDGFEAGPRALGYRSILADPRTRSSLIKLNLIKEREMWRPIAPSVLKEQYSNFFEGSADSKYFMNVATIVKEDRRRDIPAVVHVDDTARPQVVTEEHQKYYGLISAFNDLTGIPVVCNTSFNSRGMPLVNTPQDAIECFLDREIDLLVIGNFVIKKA